MSATVAVAWALIAVIATWLLIGTRGKWQPKLAIIIVAPVLAFALYQASQPAGGWPTGSQAPKAAVFNWAVVREPNQLTGDSGEIDIWLSPEGSDRPRAYAFPYTRQLHKAVQQAMSEVKQGRQVDAGRPTKKLLASASHNAQHARHQPILLYPHPPIHIAAKAAEPQP